MIQKKILNNLSKELLKGTIKRDSIVLIDAFEEELVFRNQEPIM
jgi:ATP-dependent Clp protease ATP-binding subunit ClpB